MKTAKMVSNFGSASHVREYRDRLVAEAKQLLGTADDEKRALSAEEELTHDELLGEIKRTSEALAHLDQRASTLRVLESMAGPASRFGGTGDSVGAQLVKSENFAQLRSQLGGGFGAVTMVPIELRTPLLSPAGGGPATVAAPVSTGPLPPWGEVRVAQLFPVIPAEGGNVPYLRAGATVAAAPVAEGELKPESEAAPTLVTEPLRTIAHWLPCSEQSLEDVEGLRSWIDNVLLVGLADAEEVQLIAGSGTPPAMTGLINTAGLTAAYAKTATESAADAILEQAMRVQTASRLPVDAVVLSPTAFKAITTTKADSSGVYLSGQPLAAAPLSSLWGLRYVVSAAIPTDQALVGSFRRGAAIYRKGTIRIDVSNSHSDYFIKNLVAIRAEMREVLAVFKPSAFGKVIDLVETP